MVGSSICCSLVVYEHLVALWLCSSICCSLFLCRASVALCFCVEHPLLSGVREHLVLLILKMCRLGTPWICIEHVLLSIAVSVLRVRGVVHHCTVWCLLFVAAVFAVDKIYMSRFLCSLHVAVIANIM